MQIQVNPPPAFDDFYRLLSQSEVVTSPAEIHGMLCGFVCVGSKLNGGFWIDILLKRLGVRSSRLMLGSHGAVVGLYDAACRQLSGLQSFKLLLPDAQQELEQRAEALSLWCEGFLYGLGLGGSSFDEETSDSVHEALFCIAEIAKLDVSQLEVTELDRLAYDDAIDFITQAIPLIYEELTHYPAEGGAGGSRYLH
jgi:yecA family protein